MTFIRPLSDDDPAIGGKARSLARLAALGLPAPAGFAVDIVLSRALIASGPALPAELSSPKDVVTLEAARTALLAAPLPSEFERQLADALAALAPLGAPDVTFAVRSSAPNEDAAGPAAPGIFHSCVGVRRDEVPGAVKAVLASALSPAAWSYALRDPQPSAELAVLVHRFVEATAHGAASSGPSIAVEAERGVATGAARATIVGAVVAASARFGASELEWAAQGDRVTFLQLRPFRTAAAATASKQWQGADDGWTWDAAHNPSPLSPAQAGLVALVDERCPTDLRQQVRGGYLFFSRSPPPSPHAEARPSPRALFERLAAEIDARLSALPEPPPLEAALEIYLAAYTPLFGSIQPACNRARLALKAFLSANLPDAEPSAPTLTAGVACAATRRAALAAAIAHASDAKARQAATDDYLRAFGDESPRWDVAEPTFREAPGRLLFLNSKEGAPPPASTLVLARATAASLAALLPAGLRGAFDELLNAAREAIAVGEDDDHLFARLQAAVRRALLALGERLVAAKRLPAVDDVFFLPLRLARALDDARLARDEATSLDALDLAAHAATGRRAFAEASATPPPLPRARASSAALITGSPGSPGLVLGRAVHHPPSAPLTADAVLVAVTLLPTELPLLAPAALVIETGTALGHVAAQARERGIPAVVAAHGARAAIHEGQRVIVDGARGQVTLLDE